MGHCPCVSEFTQILRYFIPFLLCVGIPNNFPALPEANRQRRALAGMLKTMLLFPGHGIQLSVGKHIIPGSLCDCAKDMFSVILLYGKSPCLSLRPVVKKRSRYQKAPRQALESGGECFPFPAVFIWITDRKFCSRTVYGRVKIPDVGENPF